MEVTRASVSPAFPLFLQSLLSVAKKLGGKLEVVSFNDDLEGEVSFCFVFLKLMWTPNKVCVSVQLKENLQLLPQESTPLKPTGRTWF